MIFFELIITAVVYLVFPLVYYAIAGKVDRKKATKLSLINVIVCCLLFIIIKVASESDSALVAPCTVTYFFIGRAILTDKNAVPKKDEVVKKENSMTTKKVIGIVLIILQILGIIGSISNGSCAYNLENFDLAYTIGYFLMGIIGVCLLVSASKNKPKEDDAVTKEENQDTEISSNISSENFNKENNEKVVENEENIENKENGENDL